METKKIESQMSTSIWFFVRLFVPLGPILIQYGLYALGEYTPEFPQPTFIILLFTLSLVTTTEFQNLEEILFCCVIPALVGTFLYTVFLMNQDNSEECSKTAVLLAGFFCWLLLVIIHSLRVFIGWKIRRP